MTTRAALVDAAEDLFATDGFDGASLRAVMRTADADPGSVHYHFGGREPLAAAVLERVLAPLNQRRLDLLAEAEQDAADNQPTDSPAITPATLVGAIVRPDLEAARLLADRGHGRARLIGSIYVNPAAYVTAEVERHFRPVAARFMPSLLAAAPGIAPETLAWRVRWGLFGIVGAILLDPEEPFSVPLEQLVDRVVTMGAAAIVAPEKL